MRRCSQSVEQVPDVTEITAILTVWKRATLERQLAALQGQSLPPTVIQIYHCGNHIDPAAALRIVDWARVDHVRSDVDFGFFGRFALAALASTAFVAVMDDDMIPGREWLAYTLDRHRHHRAVIAGQGFLLPRHCFDVRHALQAARDGRVDRDMAVDFGGCSWFFPAAWAQRMWTVPPVHLRNAEDMHFSATMGQAGVPTVVPAQQTSERMANCAANLGGDDVAAWRREGYAQERNATLAYLVAKGWRPLLGEGRTDLAEGTAR